MIFLVLLTVLSLIFEASHLTLVGQDLAVSEGLYYGGYTHDEEASAICMISVPGYYGNQVATKADYASFIREFERLALLYSTKTKLNNSTEGGAFIDGFDHIPLTDALRMLGEQNTEFAPEAIGDDEIDQRLGALAKGLKAERDVLTETHKLAVECSKLIKKIASPSDPKIKVLKRKEKKLSLSTDKSSTLQIFCQLEVASTLRQIKNARSFEDNKSLSIKLYATLKQASERLRQEISNQLKNGIKPP